MVKEKNSRTKIKVEDLKFSDFFVFSASKGIRNILLQVSQLW